MQASIPKKPTTQALIQKKPIKQISYLDRFNNIVIELYRGGVYAPERHLEALVEEINRIVNPPRTTQSSKSPSADAMYLTTRLTSMVKQVKTKPTTPKQVMDQLIQCQIPPLLLPIMRDFYIAFLGAAPHSFTTGWHDKSLAKKCWEAGTHLRDRYLLDCKAELINMLNQTLSLFSMNNNGDVTLTNSPGYLQSTRQLFSSACKCWLTLYPFYVDNPGNIAEITAVILQLISAWKKGIFTKRSPYFLTLFFEALLDAEKIPAAIYTEVDELINDVVLEPVYHYNVVGNDDDDALEPVYRLVDFKNNRPSIITDMLTHAYLLKLKYYNSSLEFRTRLENDIFTDRDQSKDIGEMELKILAAMKTIPPKLLPMVRKLFCAALFNANLYSEEIAHLATIFRNSHDILMYAIEMIISMGYNENTYALIPKGKSPAHHQTTHQRVTNPSEDFSDYSSNEDFSDNTSGEDSSDNSSSKDSSDNSSSKDSSDNSSSKDSSDNSSGEDSSDNNTSIADPSDICSSEDFSDDSSNEDEDIPVVRYITKNQRRRIYKILGELSTSLMQPKNPAQEPLDSDLSIIRGMLILVITNDDFSISEKTDACNALAKYMDEDALNSLSEFFYDEKLNKFFMHAVCNAILLYEGSDSDARDNAINTLVELFPENLSDLLANNDYKTRVELLSLLPKVYKTLCEIRSFTPLMLTTTILFLTTIIDQKTIFTFPDNHEPNALLALANIIRYAPVDLSSTNVNSKTALTHAKKTLLLLAQKAVQNKPNDYDENNRYLMLALIICKEASHFSAQEKKEVEKCLIKHVDKCLEDTQTSSDSLVSQETIFKIYASFNSPPQELTDALISLWINSNIIVPNPIIQKIVACADPWQLSLINWHMYHRAQEKVGVLGKAYDYYDGDGDCQVFYTLELIRREAHLREVTNQLENGILKKSNGDSVQPHKHI